MSNLRLVGVLAALLLTAAANAADLPADLEKAVHDYDEAQVHGNKAELQRLVADDYTLVNSSGRVQNKAELIADYTTPGYKIEPFEILEPVEKVWSDGAVMGGVVNLRGIDGGKPFATASGRSCTRTCRGRPRHSVTTSA
jgi:Domain of unknown function (DUF4440)